jgi:hypothetical protein
MNLAQVSAVAVIFLCGMTLGKREEPAKESAKRQERLPAESMTKLYTCNEHPNDSLSSSGSCATCEALLTDKK